MRLNDSVIVRPQSENKGHHHIKDPWTLSKIVSGEFKSITPQHGLPTKTSGKLIQRYRTKTRCTRIVQMSYPRNMQYLKNELWCNYNMCSSEYCSKLRNRGINSIYVGVELLYKYAGTSRRFFSVRFPTLYAKCIGKRSAWKIRQNNLLFQMNRLEGKKERKETKETKRRDKNTLEHWLRK